MLIYERFLIYSPRRFDPPSCTIVYVGNCSAFSLQLASGPSLYHLVFHNVLFNYLFFLSFLFTYFALNVKTMFV